MPPENPKRLVEALLMIKENVDMYNTFVKNASLASKKFCRKKLSIEMLKYIEGDLF